MILTLACGAGVGAGLWLTWTALRPAKPDLAALLSALSPNPPTPAPTAAAAGQADGWAARAGRPLAARLDPFRLLPQAIRRDLVVMDRDPTSHLAEKITSGLVGLALPPLLSGLLALAGIGLPLALPAVAAFAVAAGLFLGPDIAVRADAARRRRELRHAFSAFLDLTVIAMAGGAGLEQAVTDAAATGTGDAFTALRATVDHAALTRAPIWEPLTALGERYDIPDIVQTAGAMHLAGGEGARIRASLAAKADTIRLHDLSDADADAAAATERMSLPVVLLTGGFLIMIAYPAVSRVLSGL
ncbi:hypothetical protein FF36_06288 [Frankia torreyi]|uniref:Flp pilus assembly protein TadB n=1 Tax=Frankia torreyi TaxID=1856 RepID=A0A0D8B5I2_9ACTN|nr:MULTISPECIES: type II secretion system F family protein [Frankia]KJE19436.1 hypothetical protein FF36_06288 [Frankia torreyi]KQM03608.1 hypothetical protein FF86_103715 [Frankia sp. CpI1-P]